MFRIWFIILLLFVAGIAGILGWLVEFHPHYSYGIYSKVAVAVPASKVQKPGRSIDWFDGYRFEFPLRFKTESGQDVYSVAYLPASKLDELRDKGTVKVFYLPDNPRRVLLEGDLDKMPWGIPSLLFGLACFVVGVFALRARHGFFST